MARVVVAFECFLDRKGIIPVVAGRVLSRLVVGHTFIIAQGIAFIALIPKNQRLGMWAICRSALHGGTIGMANSESTINDSIAAAFRAINTDWQVYDHVSSENTESLSRKKALRPDILIVEPGVPPICIETEYEPAVSVEVDAASRLGEVATKTGGTIQAAFAIKIPSRFKKTSATKLLSELRKAQDFQYCVLSGSLPTGYERWPATGFVRGSLESLFVALQGAATAEHHSKRRRCSRKGGCANCCGSRLDDALPGLETYDF
jgi:hypothetical protein